MTSAQIAAALQAAHPGYGEGMFERVDLRASDGVTLTMDDWLGRVRSLYDLAEVARTRHRVIDGELTLLGLAELDTSLAVRLRDDGFLEALARVSEVAPRRDSTDV